MLRITGVFQSASYIGHLNFRLGRQQLSERYADRNIPVPARSLGYLVAGREVQLMMDRSTLVAMSELNRNDFASVTLPLWVNGATIDDMMLPPAGPAGALFVRSGELPEDIRTTMLMAGEDFSREFEGFVRRVCLLPGGQWDRLSPPGFDLSMTGASPRDIKDFFAGIKTDEVRCDLENDCPKTMFFNPYAYNGEMFHGTGLSEDERFRAKCYWIGGLSYLLGRMIAESYLDEFGREKLLGKNDIHEYFASIYQANKIKAFSRNSIGALGLVPNSLMNEYRNQKREINERLSHFELTPQQTEFVRRLKNQFGL